MGKHKQKQHQKVPSLVLHLLNDPMREQHQVSWMILGFITISKQTPGTIILPFAPCTGTTPITRESHILHKHSAGIICTRKMLWETTGGNKKSINIRGTGSLDLPTQLALLLYNRNCHSPVQQTRSLCEPQIHNLESTRPLSDQLYNTLHEVLHFLKLLGTPL